MKRRDFLANSSLAALAVPALARAASAPCPPPALSVDGGNSVSTSCGPTEIGPAPQWFLNAPEGAWTTVAAGASISKVVPNPWPSNPGSHPGSITTAWCGAGVDQVRGEYIMCANGGHGDYPGNEGYAIALREENPAWRRLSDPTPNNLITFDSIVSPSGAALYADGRPRAVHNTFECFGDGRLWIPQQNSFSSPSGNGCHGVVSFNRDALGDARTPLPWTASNLGPWTIHPTPDFQGFTNTGFGRAAFDKVGHKVWAVGGNNNINTPFYWSIPTTGANLGKTTVFRKGNSLDNFNSWTVIAHDLRIMVLGGEFGKKIFVFFMDKAGASDDWQVVSNVQGTGFFQMGAGGAYVPANKTIAIGNPRTTGTQIYTLRIPTRIGSGGALEYNPSGTWVWSNSTPAGPAFSLPEGANNDSYSKWNIIEDMGNGQSAIIMCTAYDGPVHVYKVPKSGMLV
jgi:hypothetical protein